MPSEFLMQQLELRETLEAAVEREDAQALERLRGQLRAEKKDLESEIAQAIDTRRDYAAAAGLVRKLMFLDRLDGEIDAAYEEID
jgi:molecular chaperone HscB